MAVKKPVCLYGEKLIQLADGDETANASFFTKTDINDPAGGLLNAKVDGTTIEVNLTSHRMNVVSGVYELVGVAASLVSAHNLSVASPHNGVLQPYSSILTGTQESFTTALKNTYDGYATGKENANVNIQAHISSTSNPHTVTKAQVGLSAVPNTDCTNATNITTGTLPRAQLPTYLANTVGAVTYPATAVGTFLLDDGTWGSPAGAGTVLSVSGVAANGITWSIATPTSTPAITLTLNAITPTSVNGLTLASQSVGFTIAGGTTSKTLTVANTASVSGTNSGDNIIVTSTPTTLTSGVIADGELFIRSGTTFVGKAIGNATGNAVVRSGTNAIAADTISEVTSATGVTVDSVLLKDGAVSGVTLSAGTNTVIATVGTSSVTVSGGAVALVGGGVSQYFIVLAGDVQNTTVVIADCTGLSATLEANKMYLFKFRVVYTTAIYSTGILLSVNGPAFTAGTLSIDTLLPLANTSNMAPNHASAYDAGIVSTQAGTATGDNGRFFYAEVCGTVSTTASDTLILRFRSEVAGSAVTIKAGSLLELVKVN